jgi:ubiquitin-protein ligase
MKASVQRFNFLKRAALLSVYIPIASFGTFFFSFVESAVLYIHIKGRDTMASFFWSNMMKKGGGGEKDGGKLSSSRSSTPRVGKAVSAEDASKDISESRDMYRNHREQTLKDYQIMIEYKHLKQHVPPGVYVLPSFENMRKWCGVIFLRAGFWKTGVFRFSIEMPPNYPGDGARPTIKFLNQVFHPLVDYRTGEVDLATRFPNWVGGEHYVLFCLKYLKQMFYLPQASNGDGKFILQMITEGRTKNDEATRLWLTEKKRFMEMAAESAQISTKSEILYSPEVDTSLKFGIYTPAHEAIREHVLKTGSAHGFQHSSPSKQTKPTVKKTPPKKG